MKPGDQRMKHRVSKGHVRKGFECVPKEIQVYLIDDRQWLKG